MAVTIKAPGGKAKASEQKWSVSASSHGYEVGVESGIISGGGGVPYTGEYEAVPSWDEQIFATKNKSMSNDFTVRSMVELEVMNDAGGLTLTI